MPSDISLLSSFLFGHPSILVTLAASAGALATSALYAGWRAANYLNKREIEDYKRHTELRKAEHQQDVAHLAKQAGAGFILDEDFPSIGTLDLANIPIGLPNAKYYGGFNIVLAQEPPADVWEHRELPLKEIFSDWFGSALTTDPHLKEGYRLIGDDDEHLCLLWRGTKAVVSVTNSPVLKRMYPFVIVRSIRNKAGADPTTEELFNFIYWLQMWDKAMPEARFEIVKMHRTPNKAYLRGHYRFVGLEVEESQYKPAKKYNEYFLMRQIFAFRSDYYTTIIATGLPNRELVSDPYYHRLKEWWEALRLVEAFRK
jgi:hypothetical protein